MVPSMQRVPAGISNVHKECVSQHHKGDDEQEAEEAGQLLMM